MRGRPTDTSPWLKVGDLYDVLEVVGDSSSGWLFRIETREGLALFPGTQFEIISPSLPPSWIVQLGSNGLYLGPRAWCDPAFWEAYYDGDEAAIRTYELERDRILSARDANDPRTE